MHKYGCPDCGRYLTTTDAPDGTRQRLYCRHCRKWKLVILAPATRLVAESRAPVLR